MKRLVLLSVLFCVGEWGRDWKKFPAVAVVDGAQEIFAVGDAHGDAERLVRVLQAAGVIDAQGGWTAGQAVLVSTGDMIDKGPSGLDVIRFYSKLREGAAAKGGRVIVLSGNHEAEFMADPTIGKAKDFVKELKKAGIAVSDVTQCKGEIGEFFCSLAFAARVNDVFFSHAGNSGGRNVAQLESDIEKDFDQNGFAAKQLIGDGSVIEARLNGEGKGREPWIDAGLPGRSEKQLLQDYTKALGVTRIVEGHVPGEVKFTDGMARGQGEMFQRFGMLYLIDTGMSRDVDESQGAVLRLTVGKEAQATAICPDGKKTRLWDLASGQDVGRAGACGK